MPLIILSVLATAHSAAGISYTINTSSFPDLGQTPAELHVLAFARALEIYPPAAGFEQHNGHVRADKWRSTGGWQNRMIRIKNTLLDIGPNGGVIGRITRPGYNCH